MADAITEAQALIEKGDPRRAADLLQAVIANGRGGMLARIVLGRAQLAAGERARALETLRETIKLAPGIAEAALALGEALSALGYLPTAIAEMENALRLDPRHERARYALGSAWLDAGEWKKAQEILSEIDASSELAPMVRARLTESQRMGAAPRAAPGYVRHLFDQFSADYDRRMLEDLSYRAPAILRELAGMLLAPRSHSLAILDLGCGTGLSGAAFEDLAARLDGVDLSPRMIQLARKRGIYDMLDIADLESALGNGSRTYDLMIAADTLVYLGDLTAVFCGVSRRLKAGAHFLFTVEKMDDGLYELGAKRRYRHSETYIREEAARAGLEVMGLIDCTPRMEAKQPVAGFAVALQRPEYSLT